MRLEVNGSIMLARRRCMTDELQRRLRTIHDLERAIRFWELLRDNAQGVVNEIKACSENQRDPFETYSIVAEAVAYIDSCNARILAAKARIDELASGD